MPLAAQVAFGVKFTAPFPFYVGDTLMPSGSYSLTQPDDLFNKIAVVKSEDGSHSAYIDVNPPNLLSLRLNLRSSSRDMGILCTSIE